MSDVATVFVYYYFQITNGKLRAIQRMMSMVKTQDRGLSPTKMPFPKQSLEVNSNHEIIVGLNELRNSNPAIAKVLAERFVDNVLVAAGLTADGGPCFHG